MNCFDKDSHERFQNLNEIAMRLVGSYKKVGNVTHIYKLITLFLPR